MTGQHRFPALSWTQRLLLVLIHTFAMTPLGALAETDWPRTFSADDGAALLVYQPQIEAWPDYTEITARAAFEAKLPEAEENILGALRVQASTAADLDSRVVVLDNIRISDTSFPGVTTARIDAADAVVRRLFPTKSVSIELDRLLANLDRERVEVRTVESAVRPPKVFTSESDAVLVLIDGEPLFEPVGDSDLMVVINTPSDLFWHKRLGAYYLRVGQSWLSSFKPEDGWTTVQRLPDEFGDIDDTPGWADVRAAVPGEPFARDDVPEVFLSTEPAALLVFDGKPNLTQVPDTELLFATNTESDVFLDIGRSGDFYVLLAGRWFRMATLSSPLTVVGQELPDDFANIPAEHPAGRVLVSVPGTQQAQEAVLGAQVPVKTKVLRSEATAEVSYEGDPIFEAIPGTEVEYAVNTSLDVFRIANRYFVCADGVWFQADDPLGPWALADEVPPPIYSIPSTSPKYHVTHTYTYEATDDYVETGYDAGYLGAFVVGGLLVYGISNADYVHVRACTGHCRPYYRHHHRVYRTQPVRHPSRHRHVFRHQVYGYGRHYDHLTGRYRRTAEVRRHHSIRHPYDGPRSSRPGGVAHSSTSSVADRQAAIAERTITGAPGTRDVYTGSDGELYKRESGGWSRYENGRWQDAGPPQRGPSRSPAATTQPARAPAPAALGNAVRARTDGAARPRLFQSYRNSRASAFARGPSTRPSPGRRR